MLAKAESKPDIRFRGDDPELRGDDRFDAESAQQAQGAQAGTPPFLAEKRQTPRPSAKGKVAKPAPRAADAATHDGDRRAHPVSRAQARPGQHGPGRSRGAAGGRVLHGAQIRALRVAPALRETEDEPAEAPAEPPDPYGPIAIETPEPLTPAAIEGDYAGPAVLSGEVVVQSPPPSGGRPPDPFDATALERARAEFQRLAEVARRDHDELQNFLHEMAAGAIERHKALEEHAAAFIGETGPIIDRATLEAQDGINKTERDTIHEIDRASLHARRLVWGTAGAAKSRIHANAQAAKTDLTNIINDLAKSYTDVLREAAAQITEKKILAETALNSFINGLPDRYPEVPAEPNTDVENEAERNQAPLLSKFADPAEQNSVPAAADRAAQQFTDGVQPVLDQFRLSELGKALDTRKNEIQEKGDKAVDKASGQAIHSLENSTHQAKRTARQMARSARQTLESQRKGFRARMASEGRSLLAVTRGESQGALNGLSGAAKAGLPAFGNTMTAVERSLRSAAENGGHPLDAAVTGAVDDVPNRMAAIARVQREKLETTNANSRLSIDTREALSRAQVDSDRGATLPALAASQRDSARQLVESTRRQTSGFDSVAKGVSSAAKEWEAPLAEVFKRAIQDTKDHQKNDTGEGSFNDWSQKTKDQRDAIIAGTLTPYLNPDTAAAITRILSGAASRAHARLNMAYNQAPKALNSGIIDVVDETALGNALRGLTAIQGRALVAELAADGVNLYQKLEFLHATNDLSTDDYDAARAYLAGNTAEGAAHELHASIHWYNDEESRIEGILRDLSPDEMAQLKRRDDGEALNYVRDHLDGTDLNVVDALAAGNPARADAYRMRDEVDEARRKGDNDALNDVLARYSRASADRAWENPPDANTRRVRVQQEMAFILGGGEASATASTIKPEDAAAAVETYALRPVEVPVYNGDGGAEMVTLNVTDANADLAKALITHGEDSVETRVARLGVEIQRPDHPDVLRLDTALYDPRLDPNNEVSPEDRQRAREQRQQMFDGFASTYGKNNPNRAQMSVQEFAAHQFGNAFGDDALAANLATRMVNDEHPTAETAAIAMQYAARGVGTKEDVIWRFSERLDRDQIQDMRAAYKRNTGSGLDEDFGAFGKGGFFTELSGDDRLRFERALLGKPRNDEERLEVAAFTAQQQRDNTGWFGSFLASGSDADKILAAQERNLTQIAGATIHIDGNGNPIWYGRDGKKIEDKDRTMFDQGRFRGNPNDLDAAVDRTQAAAENYAARIDTYANFATAAIAIIGAVAATVLTGGAASPLLAAAIAGTAGLVGMGVHWAISGGRYGWEQAVTDLGMTAVQALTAGVGQHLALLSRGANLSFGAGMTTFRAIEGVGTSMGALTGTAVGDMILMGAATSGLGSLGQAALSEKTWDKGIGAGFEELFASAVKGIMAGGATAAVSQAFEHIPLGKAGNIGEVMGGTENAVVHAGLRGTSSALGGMAGRAVEQGMDSDFYGDSGDFFEGMREGGGQAALQDFVGGLASHEGPHGARPKEGQHPPPGSAHEPPQPGGLHPGTPGEETPERAGPQHDEAGPHPEQTPHAGTRAPHAGAGPESGPLIPPTAAPLSEHLPAHAAAPPPEAQAPQLQAPETPAAAEHPAPVETAAPTAAAVEHPAPVPTSEASFAEFEGLIKDLEQSPLGDQLGAAPSSPAPAPTDPTRTRQQAYDAAYRGSRAAPPGEAHTPTEQIQHWTKVREGSIRLPAGMDPMHPDVINENRSWLQSPPGGERAARTLLTDPEGGGTRYFVSPRDATGRGYAYGGVGEPFGPHEQLSLRGMGPPPPERIFGTEHRFADRYLIPEVGGQIQARRAELGLPPLGPRELAIAAGEQARWIMEGTPGTTRSGAVIDLGRAGPQQLLLAPETLSPELHRRGLTVEPPPAPVRQPAETPQTSFDFTRPPGESSQLNLNFERPPASAGPEPGGGSGGPGHGPEPPTGGPGGGGPEGGGGGGGRFDFTDADFEQGFGGLRSEGPPVGIKEHEGRPARILEIGAGMVEGDLGLPPRSPEMDQLVQVTPTDLNPSRPGVTRLDATQPLDPVHHGQYDTVLINNPRRYTPNIEELGRALQPDGRIIIQGKAREYPKQRGINPDFQRILDIPAPPGYKKTIDLEPGPPGTSHPEHILGGPFHSTTGEPVGWPNARVIFDKLPAAPHAEALPTPVAPESTPHSGGTPPSGAHPATHAAEVPAPGREPSVETPPPHAAPRVEGPAPAAGHGAPPETVAMPRPVETEEIRPPSPEDVTHAPEREPPSGGTAAAVGGRFRGDFLADYLILGKPSGYAAATSDVRSAMHALTEGRGPFAGFVQRGEGENFPFTLRTRSGEEVNVRIEVVSNLKAEEGGVPVARWDRTGAREYVIRISENALGTEVQRGLAHEMAEIRVAHNQAERPDALRPGGKGAELSAHDEGRLAELEVLSRQIAAAKTDADRVRLRDDAEQLAHHLGLTGDSASAQARAEIARKALPPDSEPLKLLNAAIASAPDNPFVQVTTGNLEEDIPLLARRLEMADRMGDKHTRRRIINDARVLLIGEGAVGPTPLRPRGRRGEPRPVTIEGSAVSDVVQSAREVLPAGSRLLDEALEAAKKNIVLSPEERAAADRKPLPAEGFRAVQTPPAPLEIKAPSATMGPIEQERNRLMDLKKSRARAGASEKELRTIGAAINRQSELAGELAGRAYAEKVLGLPASGLVSFGRRGSGLPDLLYLHEGRIVVIECKGGEAELGVRRSVSKTFYVEQGTHEYLRSLGTEMASPGKPANVREKGRQILEALKNGNPPIDYYLVQQPFDTTGRATAPEVSKFDLNAGRVR